MYDPQLTISELRGHEIVTMHHLRHVLDNMDSGTAKEAYNILERQCAAVRRTIREIAKPKNFMMYCRWCSYNHPPNESRRSCPHCGEALRWWNLDLGNRPG